MSIAAIAEKHGVSSSQIKLKAKAGGWARDLSSAIKARAKAKVAQIDVQALIEQSANESASKSAKLIQQAIEEASDVAAGIIVRHRADIRLQFERAQRLEALFDDVLATATTTKPVVEFGQDGGEREIEAINVGDIQKLSQSFKTIIEARAKLIDKEREAFCIGDADKPGATDPSIEVTFVDVADRG